MTINPTGLNEAALFDVITAKLQALGAIGDELASRTPEHSANWILGTLNQLPPLLNDLNTLQHAAQILAKESRY